MRLLALDTSTERLCVALCLGDAHGAVTVHAHEEAGGPSTSQRLLPAAEDLLRREGLAWRDLDGLAFGQGPGAFTGLRGTCAAVQGLALGLGLQSVGIPSLRIVAEDARRQAMALGELHPDEACEVWVAVDARMGQVYDGAEAWDGHQWRPLAGPAVREPAEVAREWLDGLGPTARDLGGASCGNQGRPAAFMAGSGLVFWPEAVAQQLRPLARGWFNEEANRARALGHCATQAWCCGRDRLDAAQVMPLYVRDRVAQTTAERLQAQASAVTRPDDALKPMADLGAPG